MPLPVKLKDVVEALEATMEEVTYLLDKRTGEIILITEDDRAAIDEDLPISEYPEWQRETILKAREVMDSEDSFIELPDKSDIHDYQIMEDFAREYNNREIGERLLELIRGSGAFRRFKDAIYTLEIHNDWHQFHHTALEEIAIDWLSRESIDYVRD